MDEIEKLAEYFAKFPGIGRRQSKRFVYFLLRNNSSYRNNLFQMIKDLNKNISQCYDCFRFFQGNGSDTCEICGNKNIDNSKLMIVEKDSDLENINKAKIYEGKYFILGGLIPLNDQENPFMRIKQLFNRVEKEIKNETLKEVIFALSLSTEGEHTRIHLQDEIEKRRKGKLKISTLGRGLSTGTELEYSDEHTLKEAFESRK